MNSEPNDCNQPTPLPIDGVLDLHTFRPSEIGSLIDEYISVCLAKDIRMIRIIHGKGSGTLRRSVHSLLERNDHVTRYSLASDRSGWGATIVTLKNDS